MKIIDEVIIKEAKSSIHSIIKTSKANEHAFGIDECIYFVTIDANKMKVTEETY
jgi:hypothetical protein